MRGEGRMREVNVRGEVRMREVNVRGEGENERERGECER